MSEPRRGGRIPQAPDGAVLAILVLVATLAYLPALGFYSDDWSFLGSMRTSGSSLVDQFGSLGDVRMRPVQGVLLAGLYHVFGTVPLAFHVVNTAALVGGVLCFHLVLVELGLPRAISCAVPLLYGMLPHYSADRFWIAAMQATVSMLLYFASLYADLRAMRSPGARDRWWALAAVTRVLCVLAYEVFLPLLLLNPLIAWVGGRRRAGAAGGPLPRPSGLVVSFALAFVTLAPALAYKAAVATRLGGSSSLTEHLQWLRWIYRGAATLALSDFGIWLPRAAWRLWRDSPSVPALLVALGSGLLAFGWLSRLGEDGRRKRGWLTVGLGLVAAGVAVFGAGYAIFLVTKNAANTAAGIGNRIAIAATVGVALAWVGVLSAAMAGLPSPVARSRLFAGATAALYAACVFINVSLATFWIEAWRREREVLAAIVAEFPAFPGPGTLIIDGVCPYVGPAVVFESSWDLAGALQTHYGRRGLQADIITPNLRVTDTALVASLYYGILVTAYPYVGMQIFDVPRRRAYPVPNATAARRYLETFNPRRDGGCPIGKAGEGVPVF